MTDLLLVAVILWMITGALTSLYTVHKIVTIIVKKVHKTIKKGTPNDKN